LGLRRSGRQPLIPHRQRCRIWTTMSEERGRASGAPLMEITLMVMEPSVAPGFLVIAPPEPR
jgi:hypothetical protein